MITHSELVAIGNAVYADMKKAGCLRLPTPDDLHYRIMDLGARTFGRCHSLNGWRDGSAGYEIQISSRLCKIGAKAVAETVCHELIHAMDIRNHGALFRRVAERINRVYPGKYNVARCSSWQAKGMSDEDVIENNRYVLKCPQCGHLFVHQRMCNGVKHPERYWCVACHKIDPTLRLVRIK